MTRPYSCSSEEEANRPWTPGLPVSRRDRRAAAERRQETGRQLGDFTAPKPPDAASAHTSERARTKGRHINEDFSRFQRNVRHQLAVILRHALEGAKLAARRV